MKTIIHGFFPQILSEKYSIVTVPNSSPIEGNLPSRPNDSLILAAVQALNGADPSPIAENFKIKTKQLLNCNF